MLEHPKSFHSFVETEHLGGAAGKAASPPSVAAAVNLRTRQNLTLIAKDLHTTDNPDTFETKESYLQKMAYIFLLYADIDAQQVLH
ncbi:hypothetical protein BLNAU_20928 [Blattamonas nauphoetae]|uniref:Uncharacterized protein n=1 Tax=Blattamonas nauphoetae TaxID=2049346 RepID=A0ABQ9WXV5_9EUKA|nr:hypothetical protein BLNAU_20928 [Blattamonas nauphoetae]